MITARLRHRLGRRRRWYGLSHANPVLVQGLGLALVAVSATRLKNAVAISYLVAACTLALSPVSRLSRVRALPRPAQVLLYVLLSGVVLQLAAVPLRRAGILVAELGAYLPVTAVNTVTLTLCLSGQHGRRSRERSGRAWVWSLGFALAACTVGALRELLAFGALWGRRLSFLPKAPLLPTAALPFGGLILLGLLCAGMRGVGRWRHRMMISLGSAAERGLAEEGPR